ncbi:MAG: hypothetical protein K1X75_07005 [Leptospirales bacterium]|nr:hypothetical protein [Leptospirales bacterium]
MKAYLLRLTLLLSLLLGPGIVAQAPSEDKPAGAPVESPVAAPAPAAPAPATRPAAPPQQKQPERREVRPPAAPRPQQAAAPSPASPDAGGNAPVGVLNELPDLDFGFIPGYEAAARESFSIPEGAEAADPGPAQAEQSSPPQPRGPGFFSRLWDKFGADKTYLNLLLVVGAIILFIFYRLRGGRGRP